MFVDIPSSFNKSLIGEKFETKDLEEMSLKHTREGVNAVAQQHWITSEPGKDMLDILGQTVATAYDLIRISQSKPVQNFFEKIGQKIGSGASGKPTVKDTQGQPVNPGMSNVPSQGGGGGNVKAPSVSLGSTEANPYQSFASEAYGGGVYNQVGQLSSYGNPVVQGSSTGTWFDGYEWI
jgi:hypothetical protein